MCTDTPHSPTRRAPWRHATRLKPRRATCRAAAWLLCLAGLLATAACGGDDPAAGPDTAGDASLDATPGDASQLSDGFGDIFTRAPCETNDDCAPVADPCQYPACVPGVGCVTFALPDGGVCKHGDASCQVGGTCQGAVCKGASDKDCDDDEVCTVDSCADGACKHAPVSAKTGCDDGDPCTATDLCEGGSCKPGAPACQCGSDADCAKLAGDDKCAGTYYCDLAGGGQCKQNEATVVVCATGKDTTCRKNLCDPKTGACKMTDVAEDKSCEDGDKCTIGDQCKGGKCQAGVGVCCKSDVDCVKADDGDPCTGTWFCNKAVGQCFLNPATVVTCSSAKDTTCEVNACDPKTGACAMTPTKDGLACDDGNPCTADASCSKGACKPGKNTCPCTQDKDCADKDDGDLCNGLMFCNKNTGTCQPDPSSVVVCPSVDDTPCTKNLCDPKTGACVGKPEPNLTPCYDGNPCTTGDVCEAGKCKPGKDACECSSDAECGAWEDGDLCNGTLFCDKASKSCKIDPKTVVGCKSADNTTCKKSLCQPKTGKCVVEFVNEGLSCDDGVPCTVGDVCASGACKAGADVCKCKTDPECAAQDDGDLCNGIPYCDKSSVPWLCKTNPKSVVSCKTVDDTFCSKNLCQPKTGKCVVTEVNVDVPCDDGNPCTKGTQCKSGTCVNPAINPKAPCNDGNPCTNDNCDPKAGCQFKPNTLPCDDGDKCTDKDVCAGGVCKPGNAVDCGDGNACTTEICNAKVGCLAFDNASVCDDGDKCTPVDVCKGGVCVPGDKKPCFDGKPCTLDGCDTKTGSCTFGNVPGNVVCNDGIACTVDTCETSKGCVHAPSASKCGDGIACTSDLCVVGSGCVHQPASAACDDKNPCTVDTCVAGKGCTNVGAGDGAACSDGKPCTVGDACKAGKCVPGPVAPSCLVDPKQCQGKTDGATCNDGDACTKGEVCQAGMCVAPLKQAVVTSLVGYGKFKDSEDGHLTRATLNDGGATAVAPDGATWFSSRYHSLVRRMALDGEVRTIAGARHEKGYRDGIGSVARFSSPNGLAVDSKGGVAVGDTNNHRIRWIDAKGVVTTLAGSGKATFADGKGIVASFYYPRGLSFDDKDQLYVADHFNNRIRRITSDGTVTTLAGSTYGFGEGKGGAGRFRKPMDVAYSPLGYLVVVDHDNHALRKVTLDGVVSTITRHAKGWSGLVDGKKGVARMHYPWSVTADATGTLYVADTSNHAVRQVTPDGTVKTIAGAKSAASVDGIGTAARFSSPRGIAWHPAGRLLVTEDYRVRAIELRRSGCDDGDLCTTDTCDPVSGKCAAKVAWCTDGVPACLKASCDSKKGSCSFANQSDGAPCDDGDACTTAHTCYRGHCTAPASAKVLAGKTGGSTKYDYGKSDGAPATARFRNPAYMVERPDGSLLVSDYGNHLIRAVAPDGWVTTVAGQPDYHGWQDGPGSAATFYHPLGMAIDAQGSVWIADSHNHRVRKMSPDNNVTTVAGSLAGFNEGQGKNAKFNRPWGIDVEPGGSVLVTDHLNHRIRRVAPDGAVTTLIGGAGAGWVDGPVASARTQWPTGLSRGADGIVYFTQSQGHAVRRILPSGIVDTIGGYEPGFRDANTGPAALFNSPQGLAIDASGVVYVGDRINHRVRAIYPDGRVRTLVGHAVGVGDGTGKAVGLNEPIGLLLRGSTLYVADFGAHEIRTVQLAAKDCDDGKPCTIDRCAPLGGCVSVPMSDGLACDDGKPCTEAGSCKAGVCVAGKAVAGCTCKAGKAGGCDDGKPCTADGCDPKTGCWNKPTLEGRPCDDGSVCTSGERCGDGSCSTAHTSWSSWRWASTLGATQMGDGWRLPTAGSRAYAGFGYICGTDIDAAGAYWIADCSRHGVRRIDPSGNVTTVAGDNAEGRQGYLDGPPRLARFNAPTDIAIGVDGTAYVSDYNNHSIRVVDDKGAVSTRAGKPTKGYADGKGDKVRFNYPVGLAVDPVGNVYVTDRYNYRVRRVAPDGQVATLAGSGKSEIRDGVGVQAAFGDPFAIERDSKGRLIVSDLKGAIRRVSLDGLVQTLYRNHWGGTGTGVGRYGGSFGSIMGLAVGKDDTLYIADDASRRVRRITAGGLHTIIAGSGKNANEEGIGTKAAFYNLRSIAITADGRLLAASRAGREVFELSHGACDDHNQCTVDSCDPKAGCKHTPADPKVVCADNGPCVDPVCDAKKGRCTWTQRPNGSVCGEACDEVCMEGVCAKGAVVSTWMGNGNHNAKVGPRQSAQLNTAYGIAEDSKGNVFIGDAGNHVVLKIDTKDEVSVFAGAPAKYGYQEGSGSGARFNQPRGVAIRSDGSLVVSDYHNHRVRQISPSGLVSTLAGSTNGYKDGTGTLARFSYPRAVAVRPDGAAAVADRNNQRIRLVDKTGKVTTYAGSGWGFEDGPAAKAKFHNPNGVVWGPKGALFVLDSSNNRIRRIDQGVVTTVAGWGAHTRIGKGRDVSGLYSSTGFALLPDGRFVVASYKGHRVRLVEPDGTVRPLAGRIAKVQDGLGVDGLFYYPVGIGVRANGEILVGTQGYRVRRLRLDLSSCAGLRGISAQQAATSCKQILKTKAYTDIPTVWVDPDGKGSGPAFATRCDLTTDGGGWTQVKAEQGDAAVNALLGGKGQVMFKCSPAGKAHVVSPMTTQTWAWSKKQATPGDWLVSGGAKPASKVTCGADASFNTLSCGFGFGCAAGATASDAFILPGTKGAAKCADTKAAYTGGPMTVCTKPTYKGPVPDPIYGSWSVFVRAAQ